jgi:flagellar biosynthesis/type III secretory pathway protein FliH
MSFLLWQRDCDLAIGSARLVLRADEVPQLLQAQQLRDELDALRREQAARIDAACAAAHAEGLASGLEQGRRDARDELATAITAITHTVAEERARLRDDVAALALQVVRKLMGQGSVDARLAALAAVAAREMLPAQSLTLVVHPGRCEAVRAALAQRAASANSEPVPVFEVRGDEHCATDDCRIETEFGCADASLDAQLASLAAAWGVAETPLSAAKRRAA